MKRERTLIIWLPILWCIIQALSCTSPRAMLKMDFGERFDLNSDGLRGRVKEYRKKSSEGILHVNYDVHGNKVLERKFTPQMKAAGTTEYKNEYYRAGRIKRCVVFANGIPDLVQEYNEYYDITVRTVRINDRMIDFHLKYKEGPSGVTAVTIEEHSIGNTGRKDLTQKTVEIYDRGYCIKKDCYDKNGRLSYSEKAFFDFDRKGQVLAMRSGATESSFIYDDRGRIKSSRSINHAGAFGHTTRYAYGPKGFLKGKMIEEFSPAVRTITGYTYDPDGNLLEVRTNSHGKAIARETFVHDEAGNVIEKKTLKDGKVTTEKYEYVYWQ